MQVVDLTNKLFLLACLVKLEYAQIKKKIAKKMQILIQKNGIC